MSSTNMNMGMDGRPSSRVIKPPGGAHTDIFGASDNSDSGSARFTKQGVKSSISECFDYKNSPQNKQINENGDNIKSNGEDKIEENITTDENSKPNESATIPTRVRVPPGGFSSSLW